MFTLFFGIYEYRREHAFRVDILHSQLQLNNYHYLEHANDRNIRVTVMDTLGNVLSDTEEEDVRMMGNHLQREEVLEALSDGSGYAIKRASETNGEKYFYSATRFDDRIVRSSVPYSAELTSSLEHDYTFLYYTVGILVLIAVATYFRHRYGSSEQEKQRIKRQLTENAAHELKTPAATIEGYLETLVNNPDIPKDKQKDFLERCHAQSRRMSRLLADMSMLSRLDETGVVRQTADIDVAAIIQQIADETMTTFRELNISLQIKIPASLPMQGDASLVYSLFRNVFNNALAYATNATYFKVEASATSDYYTFTFTDNGPGIPSEHLPHIFERFYRIDKGRSRRLGGTGLGLAIVKNIALQYDGHAFASPTPGGGLTIEVVMHK
ncbi:MAG: hypothetical protein KBT34_07205 [Prevotella sp.]|nr:hypothetical protein [Candidatus Prevotella equi]